MRAIRFDQADEFERRVTPFLLRNEAENSHFLGLMSRFKTQADAVLCAVEDGGEIVAIATMTPPLHLLVSRASPQAAGKLADLLTDQRIAVPGVQGVRKAVDAFIAQWTDRHPVLPRQRRGFGSFALDRVIPPAPVRGSIRVADMSDLELMLRWGDQFAAEIDEPQRDDARTLLMTAINEGRRFLWCDPDAVSVAGIAGPTPNGIRINFVYTPPEHRRRGYASNCVAAVSQRMLDEGKKFCFLFTDLANPTSNKIYQAIGYRHVCDQVQIMFDPSPSGA